MNTQIDPADDIIELTDIVEEGTPADEELDFAMDKAVDAGSLDRELDDLLRDEGSAPKPEPDSDPIMELDDLFEEPQPAQAQPVQSQPAPAEAAAALTPADDLSDLDDLFDSLQMDDKDEEPSSLDLILGEKSQGMDAQPAPTPATLSDDTIDLDLDVPDLDVPNLDAGNASPDLLELTDELLADIPDTVLVPPKGEAGKASAIPAPPSPEGLDLDIGAPLDDAFAAPTPEAVAADHVAPPKNVEPADVQSVSQAELEILSARLDALEARPEPSPDVSPEVVLAALPQSPDDLPLAAALRSEILDMVETRVADLAQAADLETLRQGAAAVAERMDALEARPEPAPDISPELILAALPQSPDDLPLAAALRSEILDMVETRVADLAQAESVSELRQALDALRGQLDSLPETLAAPQAQDGALDALDDRARDLEQRLAALHDATAEKDALIMELREGQERLREELEALSAQLEAQPGLEALKAELDEHVRQQVPSAVARIIREEVQALLKEMGA